MAVKRGIKWTPKQLQKLAGAVEGYNERLVTAVKQNPTLMNAGLKQLSTETLQRYIPTAKELDKFVTMLNETKKKGAWDYTVNSQGVPITKHQLVNLNKLQTRTNQNRAQLREGLPEKPEYYGTASDIKRNALPNLNIDWNEAGYKRLKRLQESLLKQSLSSFPNKVYSQYAANYFKAIEKNLGKSYADELKKILKDVDPELLYKSYYRNEDLTIRYIYTGSGNDTLDERFYEIVETWSRILETDGD